MIDNLRSFNWSTVSRVAPSFLQDLYLAYKDEQRRLYGGRAAEDAICSRTFFYKVWREDFRHVRCTIGRDFMLCDTCTSLNQRLHGTPGVRSELTSDVRASLRQELLEHTEVSANNSNCTSLHRTLKHGVHTDSEKDDGARSNER